MTRPVSSIRNLGPKSEVAFARAGIETAEEVHEIGAEEAYIRLLRSGTRPHFIGFYALWLGLQGRPWNDLRADEKAGLRAVFDGLVARVKSQPGGGMSRELIDALDEMGVVTHRSK